MSEPLTLDEEVHVQEEWHCKERKCTFVILARDLLLLITILATTTGLPFPSHRHCTFRRRCVSAAPSIDVALTLSITAVALPSRRRIAVVVVAATIAVAIAITTTTHFC